MDSRRKAAGKWPTRTDAPELTLEMQAERFSRRSVCPARVGPPPTTYTGALPII